LGPSFASSIPAVPPVATSAAPLPAPQAPVGSNVMTAAQRAAFSVLNLSMSPLAIVNITRGAIPPPPETGIYGYNKERLKDLRNRSSRIKVSKSQAMGQQTTQR